MLQVVYKNNQSCLDERRGRTYSSISTLTIDDEGDRFIVDTVCKDISSTVKLRNFLFLHLYTINTIIAVHTKVEAPIGKANAATSEINHNNDLLKSAYFIYFTVNIIG